MNIREKIQLFLYNNYVLVSALLSATALALQQVLSAREMSWKAIGYAVFIAALGVITNQWKGRGLTTTGIIATVGGVFIEVSKSGNFTWSEFTMSIMIALISAASAGLQAIAPPKVSMPGKSVGAALLLAAMISILAVSCSSTRSTTQEKAVQEHSESKTVEVKKSESAKSGTVQAQTSSEESTITIEYDSATFHASADPADSAAAGGTPPVATAHPGVKPARAGSGGSSLQQVLSSISGTVKSVKIQGKVAQSNYDSSYHQMQSNFDSLAAAQAIDRAEWSLVKEDIKRRTMLFVYACFGLLLLLILVAAWIYRKVSQVAA